MMWRNRVVFNILSKGSSHKLQVMDKTLCIIGTFLIESEIDTSYLRAPALISMHLGDGERQLSLAPFFPVMNCCLDVGVRFGSYL